MTGTIRTTTVKGITYKVWCDFILRGTLAENTETGEAKMISKGGYITNDLTIRKAIAAAFQLNSFRK